MSDLHSELGVLSCRSECSNCEVGEHCGVIMHGNAATFCQPYGPRELVSEGCLFWGCRCEAVSLQGCWCALEAWYLAEMLLNKVIGP